MPRPARTSLAKPSHREGSSSREVAAYPGMAAIMTPRGPGCERPPPSCRSAVDTGMEVPPIEDDGRRRGAAAQDEQADDGDGGRPGARGHERDAGAEGS